MIKERKVRMNIQTLLFCRVILYLDYIPRYGRYYRVLGDGLFGPTEWKFWKRGYWGTNILDKLGLLDRIIDQL